jgi:hemoglobin-like flavoprotein
MTPHQINLVRTTFARLIPVAAEVAAQFYERLFALDPSMRALFRGDMQAQGVKLMKAIGADVEALDQLDRLAPALADLGRRHASYGMQPAHYDMIAAALLESLEAWLGSAFTPETREAWAAAYAALAAAMKSGTQSANTAHA